MYQPWGECQPENEKLDFSETYSRANCFNECYMSALSGRPKSQRVALDITKK